jgi:hypothetical protein
MKGARETTDIRDDEEFQTLHRKHDAEFRERWRRNLIDRELELMVAEITARTEKEEAKAARAARPIQVKRYTV